MTKRMLVAVILSPILLGCTQRRVTGPLASSPARRQEVSSRVTELIWQAVLQHADRVQFRAPVARQAITFSPRSLIPPAFRQSEPC